MIIAVLVFLVALSAVIAVTHYSVNRRADARLRQQFDAQGASCESSRQSMRASGYHV